jgi:uncharacterized membrane protein YgcG
MGTIIVWAFIIGVGVGIVVTSVILGVWILVKKGTERSKRKYPRDLVDSSFLRGNQPSLDNDTHDETGIRFRKEYDVYPNGVPSHRVLGTPITSGRIKSTSNIPKEERTRSHREAMERRSSNGVSSRRTSEDLSTPLSQVTVTGLMLSSQHSRHDECDTSNHHRHDSNHSHSNDNSGSGSSDYGSSGGSDYGSSGGDSGGGFGD